jgi:hypothetical protein
MKKQLYTMIAGLAVTLAMGVAAHAQTGNYARHIVNIPFEFNIGDKAMPAGEYAIRRVNPTSDRGVLQITRKGGASILVATNDVVGKARSASTLVFNCYGRNRYLAEVWTAGESLGLQARRSRGERAAENELAQLRAGREMVALRLQ